MKWWTRLRRAYLDVALAAVVIAVSLLTTVLGPNGGRLDLVAWTAGTVAGGALVARRRHPLAVLVVATLAAEVYLVHYQGERGSMVLIAPLVALYTYAEASGRRWALLTGGVVVLAIGVVHTWVTPPMWVGADNLALAALGALAVAAGTASRHRRAYLAEAQARAAQAEADRDAEALRLVTEERLRIARDLHDALGHHLALIHIQARVAAHALDDRAGPAGEALAHICGASKAALTELGETVGLLRQPGEQAAPVDPVGGLDRVEDLVAAFRRSGLDVDCAVTGVVRPVAGPVDLTAFRVVQESLTNVCKHAGPTSVTVALAYRPEALEIVVDNRRTGQPPGAGAGHGHVGMRERVGVLGGAFHAGPAGDRYRVTARLPLTVGRPGMTIRVLLADDQPLVRGGFAVFVDAAPDLTVVGEAGTGEQAVARAHTADVVVMDIRMPDLDGIAATRRIAAESPATRVLVLTTFEIDEYVFGALRAGASGFLGKSAEPDELLAAIRLVYRGEQLLSPAATRAVVSRFLSLPDPSRTTTDLAVLTDREREVVGLVAAGLSNDDIARHLVVSPHTAKTHVNRAMTKLGARDRAQLVIAAYRAGLVPPTG